VDIATINGWTNQLVIFANDGDGQLQTDTAYNIGHVTRGITCQDFNVDGFLDFAITRMDNYIQVLLNQGDGTFAYSSDMIYGPYPVAITAADLDSDFDADLLIAARQGHTVGVFLNDGNGTFILDTSYYVGNRPEYSDALTTGDWDNDSDIDFAVCLSLSDSSMVVAYNNGDASFGSITSYPIPNHTQMVASGDLDGDHDLDLVTNSSDYDVNVVLWNNGAGVFGDLSFFSAPGSYRSIISVADTDADDDLDLAVTMYTTTEALGVFVNKPNCVCGDASNNGALAIEDAVYLINYLFIGGPEH
jgi:hypothetical protein